MLCSFVAWRDLATPRPDIRYWRTVDQEEVDFVIEAGSRWLPVEVEATRRPAHADARHLRTFQREYGDPVVGGLLL